MMTEKPTYEELEQRVRELEKIIAHSFGGPETEALNTPSRLNQHEEFDKSLNFESIIDVKAIQSLMDEFYDLTNIGIAIIDLDGKVLVAKGWQDICVKFHRVHPETSKNCIESDLELSNGIEPGTFRLYRCKNNMLDMATPIIVGDQKIGSLYLGQFLFDDESVNVETFRLQARKFGFEVDQYIEALEKVPRWNRQTVNTVMRFYTKFAQLISDLGYKNFKLNQGIIEKNGLLDKLRESENKYRELVENLNDVVYSVSNEGKITYVSPLIESILGYTVEELIGRPFGEFLHIDDQAMVSEALTDVLHNKLKPTEYRIRSKSNEFRWVRTSSRPIYSNGRVTGLQGVLTDITERKSAGDALKESEEKLRAMLNASPLAIVLVDRDGHILDSNEEHANRLKMTRAQILGKCLWDLLPESVWAHRKTQVESVFESGKTFTGEDERGKIWNEYHIHPAVKNKKGEIEAVIVEALDITDRKLTEDALRASVEKYRAVVESTPDGIVVLDLARNMITCNHGFSRLFGYAEDEIRGESVRLIHQSGEAFHQFGEMSYGSIGRTGSYRGEVYFRKKDGTLFPAESVTSVMEKDGSETGYVGIIRDISSRKKAEEERLRNEKDLRESQRIAHIGSWRLDVETNEVFWTEELYKMYGFDPTSPPPNYTEHMKLFTPESWSLLSSSMARTRDTGFPYELELEMVREDGSKGWIWVRGEAVTNSEGKTIGLWGAAQDITQRKGMEEALRQSEEKYKHLFNEAQVALFRTSIDGRLIEANERYAQMAGYDTVEECMTSFHPGKSWADPNARDKLTEQLSQEGSIYDYDTEIVRGDGTHILINFSATIYPEKGYIEGSIIDITSRKLAEEESEKLLAQLQQAQKMESIGNLAGGIAHDFNNILFPIVGLSELLLEDLPVNSPEHEYAERILKAGMRGSDLVKQILAFGRQSEHRMIPVRIQPVLKEVLKLIRSTIPANIEIFQNIDADVGRIMADPTQMHQIAMNLITNAYHAVEESGGKISVELKKIDVEMEDSIKKTLDSGPYAMLTISDNGCGIDSVIMDNSPFAHFKRPPRFLPV